jgi:hypothetical protein
MAFRDLIRFLDCVLIKLRHLIVLIDIGVEVISISTIPQVVCILSIVIIAIGSTRDNLSTDPEVLPIHLMLLLNSLITVSSSVI